MLVLCVVVFAVFVVAIDVTDRCCCSVATGVIEFAVGRCCRVLLVGAVVGDVVVCCCWCWWLLLLLVVLLLCCCLLLLVKSLLLVGVVVGRVFVVAA